MASAAKPSIFSKARTEKVSQERSSFLKKRTKKLLVLYTVLVKPPVAQINKSFFGSFFAKKEHSYFPC